MAYSHGPELGTGPAASSVALDGIAGDKRAMETKSISVC